MTDPTMDDASNAALAKTPSSRKTFAASMPVSWQNARTPSRAKTPGAAKTPARFGLAKTPGGKPKTPGISSRFAQAPERVVVDDKPKPKTPGGYHRQLMLPARKTPGKQPMVNPAPSMLSSLPNATHATFWLRKAAREEERTGDLVQALYHLDTGIKRGAEPVAHLQDAKDALRSRMNSATDANETEADTTDADAMSGSVVVMETVRTPNRLLDAVDGHKTVVTPVRRSARKTPDADGVSHHSSSVQRAMTHNSIQRTLSANDYAYAPNDALGDVHAHDEEVAAAAESLDEDAKLINAIGNNEDAPPMPSMPTRRTRSSRSSKRKPRSPPRPRRPPSLRTPRFEPLRTVVRSPSTPRGRNRRVSFTRIHAAGLGRARCPRRVRWTRRCVRAPPIKPRGR